MKDIKQLAATFKTSNKQSIEKIGSKIPEVQKTLKNSRSQEVFSSTKMIKNGS
jgi:hypothetical protein